MEFRITSLFALIGLIIVIHYALFRHSSRKIYKNYENLPNLVHSREKFSVNQSIEDKPFSDVTSTAAEDEVIDWASDDFQEELLRWYTRLFIKLMCIHRRFGAIYQYHTRKCASSSIREVLHQTTGGGSATSSYLVPYYSTEGISLPKEFLNKATILTITNLRDPIERIISLYWQEHVYWHLSLLKQSDKCRSLREWIFAWKDKSEWKKTFEAKNKSLKPNESHRSTYLEIENYYVKSFIDWDGVKPIDYNDFSQAKDVLNAMDLIFLKEWMGDQLQLDAINNLFPGRSNVAIPSKSKGSYKMKEKMHLELIGDESEERMIRDEIAQMNYYDLKLWEYAQSLMAYKLKFVEPLVLEVKASLSHPERYQSHSAKDSPSWVDIDTCSEDHKLTASMQSYLGVFRPVDTKGPYT